MKITAFFDKIFTPKSREIYILRRVVFLLAAIIVLISILLLIFNRKDAPASKEPDNSPGVFDLISTPTPTDSKKEKLTVLIYHTHNDESYYKGYYKYEETETGRSFDENYNVISVGKTLKNELESKGFNVIHDTSDNVSDGFNYAYDTSYKSIKKYKNVDIYIDLHRDAYSQEDGKNYVRNGIGTEYAFIRLVVGNGRNYKDPPNYKENGKLAEEITEKLNEIQPNVCREVFYKNARLNQHVSKKCLLVEIGNEKNDINQVKNSARLLASAIEEIS
ncbi:MAG: stage II sporulation protein P [Clostridia bacterium]|nr:stage II sporulation protein P [Clostridia bacterium]